MLLGLPPELILLVLQNSSTPTFLQTAFTCRTVHEIASNCREVILHHLHQTPGLNSDIQSLETKQLFRLLLRRSFKQLYGAQFSVKCTIFKFGNHALDVRASSIASSDDRDLALVIKGVESVYVFDAGHGQPRLKTELKPPCDQPGRVEVLKTAFDGEGGIYILHRFMPSVDVNDSATAHPFVRQAMQSSPIATYHMSRHSIQSPDERVRMCDFPHHAEYEPLALAATQANTFAISWQHVRDSSEYEVVLYTSPTVNDSSEVMQLSYIPCVLVDASRQRRQHSDWHLPASMSRNCVPSDKGPVIDLTFNDRSSQLLYYYRAQTLYGSFQRIQRIDTSNLPVQPTLYLNSCMVNFTESLSLLFSIAIPFFGTHERQMVNNIDSCHWKYLAFGVATHRVENWTVACLLRSDAVCRAQNCGHTLNLDRGRRFAEWTVVARLWGFKESTTSLGCIVAASNSGTRIAVANWNAIYIWALEPHALIEKNADGFYPPSSQSATSGMVELRPTVLQLDAVCFKLCFTDKEDELIAITDRGVMYWNLDPLGRGHRSIQQLSI